MNEKKYKHLTAEDRQKICDLLNYGQDFKAIGKAIGKDQTTISKEVKKHIIVREKPSLHKDDGSTAEIPVCPRLLSPPYVCNPCSKKNFKCRYEKRLYIPAKAHKEYRELLSDARTGIALNKQSFWDMDRLIKKELEKGQHLYHIVESNDIGCSLSSIYRYMDRGYLSAARIELPRAVKFKMRKKHVEYVPKACKVGRTFSDFTEFIQNNEIDSWTEMDTLIGRQGGKAILTLHFTICNFMIGILLDDLTADETAEKITALKEGMKSAGLSFHDYFPVLLTDNGMEFSNINAFMLDTDGHKETELFFCDPMCSWQKPQIEKNHTLFRDIVPKGYSFDTFSQKDVSVIFSHINSIKRKKLHGKTPYEIFVAFFGTALPDLIGIYPVPENDVIQSPKLLKQLGL